MAFGCVPFLADRRAAWRKPSATERQDRGQAQRTRTGSADAVRIRTKTKSLVFSDWCKGSRIFSSLTFPQNFLGSDHCRRNRLLWHPASETHSTSSLRDVGRRRARSSCAALSYVGCFLGRPWCPGPRSGKSEYCSGQFCRRQTSRPSVYINSPSSPDLGWSTSASMSDVSRVVPLSEIRPLLDSPWMSAEHLELRYSEASGFVAGQFPVIFEAESVSTIFR